TVEIRFGPGGLCTPHSGIAQLVEQRTVNPRVVGSSPTAGAIIGLAFVVNRIWISWYEPNDSSSRRRHQRCAGTDRHHGWSALAAVGNHPIGDRRGVAQPRDGYPPGG